MSMSELVIVILAMVAAGSAAYALIYPYLSGEARAEKRQQLLTQSSDAKGGRLTSAVSRRDQVAQSLKELEARQKSKKVTLETKISQAGLEWDKKQFYMVSLMCAAGIGFMFYIMTFSPVIGMVGAFIGAFGLPQWILSYLKKRRVAQFVEEFPNAMDVIIRGVRSGLPLGDCLRIIGNEAAEPVKTEFRNIIEMQALGLGVTEAVAKLPERVPVAEANFFAIVIAIQQKAGGNLAEAIGNLSKVLRERKKMKGKIAAMSMEAKASAAIIAALPFIVALLVYLSSPAYIELLWTKQAGQVALVASGFWMLLGVMTMKKMINFDY